MEEVKIIILKRQKCWFFMPTGFDNFNMIKLQNMINLFSSKLNDVKKKSIFNYINYILIGIIIAVYIWLRIENSQFIRDPRDGFGDTHEFLNAAKVSLFSMSFWVSIRPPIVPIFYKVLGGDLENIFNFQLWFSIFAWCVLGLTSMKMIKVQPLKILTLLVVLGFSLSEEIIMWDYIILGDSISISIMALFCASSILLIDNWAPLRFISLIVMALLFGFVRDDFAYYILMVGLFLPLFILRSKYRWRPIIVSLLFLSIFIISNSLSSISLRWYRPLLNTLSLRLLPNPEYVSYFESFGMPVNDVLMERSGKHLHADNNALVDDPRLEEFNIWIKQNGKSVYIKFLWFFKADTFQSVFNDIENIFSPNVYYYTATRFRPIISNSQLDELLFPIRFGFLLFLFSNILAATASVIAFYEKKSAWVVPLTLILLSYPQAVLVWNADANDMARHALYNNILMRLGFWLLLLVLIDFAIKKIYNNYHYEKRELAET
ncbi:MAG: hypothetical protein QGD88_09250 [Anaerolineae bacterium]|nr:hypothetical protein [Anaerolineae bacterium]